MGVNKGTVSLFSAKVNTVMANINFDGLTICACVTVGLLFQLVLASKPDSEDIIQSKCTVSERDRQCHVNCCCRGLTEIPRLPQFATSVDLSKNNITNIRDGTPFDGMTLLAVLNLSDNPLSYISTHMFEGLSNLTHLFIRNSFLKEQKDLVLDSVLSDLINLEHFAFTFQYIKHWRPFPEDCFKTHKTQPFGKVDSLERVSVLEIDSALLKRNRNATVKIAFKCKHLNLVNGDFCFYSHLTKDQFEYMPFLETLIVTHPYAESEISDDFVKELKYLKELTIEGPHAHDEFFVDAYTLMYNVTKSISSLKQISKVAIIRINNNQISYIRCDWAFYNMSGVLSLKELNLADNGIDFAAPDCTQFPSSLETLILDKNCISSTLLNFVLEVNKNIKTVEASDQSHCNFKGKDYASSFHIDHHQTRNPFSLEKIVFTESRIGLDFGSELNNYPYLCYMNLSFNNGRSPYSKSGDVVPYFFSANRPNLESLYLSNCGILDLEPVSFSNFSKLVYLDLSANKLGNMHCNLSERLIKLISLKEINMANNSIDCIKPSIFEQMKYIEVINISNNNLHTFEASLRQLMALTYLDLSYNKIPVLQKDTLHDLDRIVKARPIHLDLTGNLLSCSCASLDFLHWIDNTNVDLIGKENYKCSFSNGTITGWNSLSHLLQKLDDDCNVPNTAVIIGVSASVALCVAVVFGLRIYRCRWRLRYWYYKSKIKISYQTMGHNYEQIFEFDMFISYSSEDHEIARQGVMDELESKRGLHCCIHERDFKAGESIPFNIAKGIRECKRTMLFLSKSFLSSEWCMYELNIARMEALHTGRKVILVVMLENIPSRSLPIDVLDVIDLYTYLEYPRKGCETDIDVFWSKCADFVDDA